MPDKKSFVTIANHSREKLMYLLTMAAEFEKFPNRKILEGKVVATLFFEPSTRTGVVAMWNSNWGFPFRIPFAVIDSYHNKQDSLWLDLSELPPQ